MIEAVVFDGDQTLWDFQRVMTFALHAVLNELRTARPGPFTTLLTVSDLAHDRDEVTRELEGREFNLARLRHLGFARTLQRLQAEEESNSLADNAALAQQLTDSYFRHRDIDPALFVDTLPCLERLRSNFRLGLLSNGSRLPESIGLGSSFETVVFAQDHQVAKPDVALFRIMESLMGVDPATTVLVGDHPHHDVVGAKQAGWRAIWIDREGSGDFTPPAGHLDEPDAVITSLAQLPAVLATL